MKPPQTEQQAYALYDKNYKLISRLWGTYTSVARIEELYRLNSIALDNDLKRIRKEGEA